MLEFYSFPTTPSWSRKRHMGPGACLVQYPYAKRCPQRNNLPYGYLLFNHFTQHRDQQQPSCEQKEQEKQDDMETIQCPRCKHSFHSPQRDRDQGKKETVVTQKTEQHTETQGKTESGVEGSKAGASPPPNDTQSGTDVKPSGTDVKPSGKDVKTSGTDVKPSGKDVKPSGTDAIQSSDTNVTNKSGTVEYKFDVTGFMPNEIDVRLVEVSQKEKYVVVVCERNTEWDSMNLRHQRPLREGVDPGKLRCKLNRDGEMTVTMPVVGSRIEQGQKTGELEKLEETKEKDGLQANDGEIEEQKIEVENKDGKLEEMEKDEGQTGEEQEKLSGDKNEGDKNGEKTAQDE